MNYKEGVGEGVKVFFKPLRDRRCKAMRQGWKGVVLDDLLAELILAMVAIRLVIGFVIASRLNPVHGIVRGAFDGLLGS